MASACPKFEVVVESRGDIFGTESWGARGGQFDRERNCVVPVPSGAMAATRLLDENYGSVSRARARIIAPRSLQQLLARAYVFRAIFRQ